MNLTKRPCDFSALCSIPVFAFGFMTENYNVCLFAGLLLLAGNVYFSLLQLKERIVFFCFNAMMLLFLLGRPLVYCLRGDGWWSEEITPEAGLFAITAVYVSLLVLYVTASRVRHTQPPPQRLAWIRERPTIIKNLELFSLCLFIICILCSYAEGLERILFMRGRTYVEMYTGAYHTSMPAPVKAFIQLMKPTFFVFLSTFPSKKKAFPVLGAYLLSTLPSLVIGQRSPTMLACAFILMYYFLRDSIRTEDEAQWFGPLERTAILIMLPFLIVFLSLYTDIRNDREISQAKLNNPLAMFLQEQGTTFKLLGLFFDRQDELPEMGFPGYFFGYLYDSICRNSLIGKLFGVSFPTAQSEEMLAVSRSLNNQLSYAVLGDSYFLGHGLDSSYILDVFVDYGWPGVVVFNAVLAFVMQKTKKFLCKNWLSATLTLYFLSTLMFIPRSSALVPLAFTVNIYFWAGVIICRLGAELLTPRYISPGESLQKEKKS